MVLLWNNLKPWPLEAPFPGTSVFCSVHCLWGLADGQRTKAEANQAPRFQRTPAIHPKHTSVPPYARSAPLIPEAKQMWEKWRRNVTQAQEGRPTRPLDQCPRSPAPWGALPARLQASAMPHPHSAIITTPAPQLPPWSEAGFLWAIFGARCGWPEVTQQGQG